MSARLTDEQKRLRAIKEADWQKTVLYLAAQNSWRAHHAPKAGVRKDGTVRRTANTHPGMPDLILARRSRLVFAELKREQGKTTSEQELWLEQLEAAGVETYVWRPSDLADVQAVLGSAA